MKSMRRATSERWKAMAGSMSFRSKNTTAAGGGSSKRGSLLSVRSHWKRPSSEASSSAEYHDAVVNDLPSKSFRTTTQRSWKFWKKTAGSSHNAPEEKEEEERTEFDHSSSMRDSWSVWRSASSLRLSTRSHRASSRVSSSFLSRRRYMEQQSSTTKQEAYQTHHYHQSQLVEGDEMVIEFDHEAHDSTAFFSAAALELDDDDDDDNDDATKDGDDMMVSSISPGTTRQCSSLPPPPPPTTDDLTEKQVYNFVWEYTEALTLAAAYASQDKDSRRWKAFWEKYHTSDYQHQLFHRDKDASRSDANKQDKEICIMDRESVAEQLAQYDEYTLCPLAVESIQILENTNDSRNKPASCQEALCTFKTQQTYWDPTIHEEIDEFVTWNARAVWNPASSIHSCLQWSRMERANGRGIHDATISTKTLTTRS